MSPDEVKDEVERLVCARVGERLRRHPAVPNVTYRVAVSEESCVIFWTRWNHAQLSTLQVTLHDFIRYWR